jgi:hypothetical protein
MTDNTEFLKTVNASGFPLQIGLQPAVNAECLSWEVIHQEHSWWNMADGTKGFIDFVVRNRATHDCAVIECKRVQPSSWIFLSHDGSAKPTAKTKAWLLKYQSAGVAFCGWSDVNLNPATAQANFCTVRRQSTNDKNTFLERVSGELVSATEALAMEEKEFHPEGMQTARLYLNVIVTTAEIRFAQFSYSQLSRDEGTLRDATFIEMPYLRIRKQFSNRYRNTSRLDWLRSSNIDQARENTVFVVGAKYFTRFLNELDVENFEIPS